MDLFGRDKEEDEARAVERIAWPVPWHAHVPIVLMAAGMVFAYGYTLYWNGPREGMVDWAVSAETLREGRLWTLITHMFAHGGVMHILMNMSVFISIGPMLTARLGTPPMAWLRFFLLFLLCGLAGALLYLAVHPNGDVPMLGASGAIYGLFGVLLRLRPDGDGLIPLRSREMWLAAVDFVKQNLILILLLTVPAMLSGSGGGVAWEAHLGGILFGLFVGPRFIAEHHLPDFIEPAPLTDI